MEDLSPITLENKDVERVACAVCGKVPRDDKPCFTCKFWGEKLDRPELLVINHWGYSVGKGGGGGMGGRYFAIQKDSGEKIETNDLWTCGEIPEGEWRNRLPNNATFLGGAGVEKVGDMHAFNSSTKSNASASLRAPKSK